MNVRLLTYRPTLTASGVYINNGSGYPVSPNATVIVVDGASAETLFDEYQGAGRATLVDASGAIYGTIKSVNSSTGITLYSLEIALADDAQLYYYPLEGYELELQEAPNISVNFQFSDIKEPETRKGSYTQTFKLPFTDANNKFFQNWYNVNLSTLVFSTKTKFSATLFVGTVPQFEGYIQLKAVYQKAQYYEVVLMSNTSDLFSVIGEKKLKHVFKNSDESYSAELNHTFTYENIKKSWDGDNSSFVNIDGVALRDTDVDVQKVMYPLSVTEEKFFFRAGDPRYLNMTDSDIAGYIDGTQAWAIQSGYSSAANYMVNINQLRPAIQLKTLFKLIFARAGFSYTSTFIDGDYFGKLYTTTGNKLPTSNLPTKISEGALPGGYLYAKQETEGQRWRNTENYVFQSVAADAETPEELFWECDTDVEDDSGVWNTSTNTLTKLSHTMNWIQFISRGYLRNARPAGMPFNSDIPIQIIAVAADNTNEEFGSTTVTLNNNGTSGNSTGIVAYVDLSNANVGQEIRFKIVAPAMCSNVANVSEYVPVVALQGWSSFIDTSRMKSDWLPFNPTQYDKEVLIPECIDDTITQKAFLKDIIERFNLIFLTDPDDASNIIIETYDDYLSQSSIKDWTKKLDILKEIVVKDTTTLQKSVVNLSDLEDVDLMNKSIAEVAPSLNVYGKYYNDRVNNDFASGEFKNSPVFSPYISQQVFKDAAADGTHLANVIAQYEISYEETDEGTEAALEETKPKLFYYFGKETTIKDWSDNTRTINLHERNPTTGVIVAKGFTEYPVCSVYDINTNAASPYTEYELDPTNRSLLWNFAPPQCGNITVFNYTSGDPSWQKNSLYFRYWRQYLEGLYGADSRIMEAYFNLDEVDIFNFKFNDEIFVKDTYWRIINIHNYQVGAKASTRVTLLKVVNSVPSSEEGYLNCPYVIGGTEADGFLPAGPYYWFCSSDIAVEDCTAGTGADAAQSYLIPEECCIDLGGQPDYSIEGMWGYCLANAGSSPVGLYQLDLPITLTGQAGLKSFMQGKLGNLNLPLSSGANRGKFTQSLLPRFGDDIMIKYKTLLSIKPQVDGESHRMVLMGNTEGNTRGYAYPENAPNTPAFTLPSDANVMIQVKGISTVIGGTSSTYVVGITESFAYHTAFKVMGSKVTQIGTAGGVVDWSLKESAVSTTSTLYIAQSATTGGIDFGLDDSQTDTKRSWTLVVDLTVQNVENLRLPFGTDWALYQNGHAIQLMNYEYLIWN